MSVFDRFRLDGKRLFITGGSRELGREMALAIAEAGADVILVGRDRASLETTARDVRARGRQVWGNEDLPARLLRDRMVVHSANVDRLSVSRRVVQVPIRRASLIQHP
ncbi:MAG TPA: SDR family NAD(P)-dependent oxidoreductase [Gemmataceae bacterium]|jgi:NAD(P)-dependent dehydrogenase (short-subunit alcohol dehydrogenase family)|nr:SDR family NAD(P)-dependent oxidoreductase [Gemmataceae bacterium]